jgi:hypothetical protein
MTGTLNPRSTSTPCSCRNQGTRTQFKRVANTAGQADSLRQDHAAGLTWSCNPSALATFSTVLS